MKSLSCGGSNTRAEGTLVSGKVFVLGQWRKAEVASGSWTTWFVGRGKRLVDLSETLERGVGIMKAEELKKRIEM
jgi:hypothetical protein